MTAFEAINPADGKSPTTSLGSGAVTDSTLDEQYAHVLEIGPYKLTNNLVLAPMAGVTDRPFRMLCKQFGAAMVVSEMLTSDTRLWNSRKSQQRMIHINDPEPRSVQIAGAEPAMMAEAARLNVARGAQIIDINMGCPAKKVCSKAAGSALLRDEKLVSDILTAVTGSVSVPVTLKIRTGWCKDTRNAVAVAEIAEAAGIKALAIHGRTRACRFQGQAEYRTIAEVKRSVGIPVLANGDIDSPEKAKYVLDYTNADGLMIGRAANGRPWIFAEINHYLTYGEQGASPSREEQEQIIISHLQALHDFYGDYMGVRIARKHLGWYLARITSETKTFRQQFNRLETSHEQINLARRFFQDVRRAPEVVAA